MLSDPATYPLIAIVGSVRLWMGWWVGVTCRAVILIPPFFLSCIMSPPSALISPPPPSPIPTNQAMTMATGFLAYKSLKSPDVRLSKKERNRLARELKHSKEVSGFDAPFEKA